MNSSESDGLSLLTVPVVKLLSEETAQEELGFEQV
jgi:hypothetical protein